MPSNVPCIQRAIAELNAGNPEDRRIVFRIGINVGDIIIEGEDIYGDGVNVAARLEGMRRARRHTRISEDAWRAGARQGGLQNSSISARRTENHRAADARLSRRNSARAA